MQGKFIEMQSQGQQDSSSLIKESKRVKTLPTLFGTIIVAW